MEPASHDITIAKKAKELGKKKLPRIDDKFATPHMILKNAVRRGEKKCKKQNSAIDEAIDEAELMRIHANLQLSDARKKESSLRSRRVKYGIDLYSALENLNEFEKKNASGINASDRSDVISKRCYKMLKDMIENDKCKEPI